MKQNYTVFNHFFSPSSHFFQPYSLSSSLSLPFCSTPPTREQTPSLLLPAKNEEHGLIITKAANPPIAIPTTIPVERPDELVGDEDDPDRLLSDEDKVGGGGDLEISGGYVREGITGVFEDDPDGGGRGGGDVVGGEALAAGGGEDEDIDVRPAHHCHLLLSFCKNRALAAFSSSSPFFFVSLNKGTGR